MLGCFAHFSCLKVKWTSNVHHYKFLLTSGCPQQPHSKWVITENLDLWGIFWGILPILVAWKSLKVLFYFWLLLVTMLKIGWSSFSIILPSLFLKTVANHSAYLHSTAFHSILRQIRQYWKLGGIHLCSFIPPLFFKTVVNHSAYFHSAAFHSILRQIGQCWKLGRIHLWSFISLLFLKTVANHSAYLHSTAFCSILRQIRQCWKLGRIHFQSFYLCYSSKLWPTTQHTFVLLHFTPFWDKSDNIENWVEFIFAHSYLHYSSKLWSTTQHTFVLLHFTPFWDKSDNVEN